MFNLLLTADIKINVVQNTQALNFRHVCVNRRSYFITFLGLIATYSSHQEKKNFLRIIANRFWQGRNVKEYYACQYLIMFYLNVVVHIFFFRYCHVECLLRLTSRQEIVMCKSFNIIVLALPSEYQLIRVCKDITWFRSTFFGSVNAPRH